MKHKAMRGVVVEAKGFVANGSAAGTTSVPCTGPYSTPPWTTADRLRHIDALARQVNSYIQVMCHDDGLVGTSTEVRDKAIADLYEAMVQVERALGRVHKEFKLA